jgi:hypothetical protein
VLLSKENTKFIAARVPKGLAAEFERVCREDERSISAELRRLIRRRVEQAHNDEGRADERVPVTAATAGGRDDHGT